MVAEPKVAEVAEGIFAGKNAVMLQKDMPRKPRKTRKFVCENRDVWM